MREATIDVGGKSYPMSLTTNAVYMLEMYLRQNNLGTPGALIERVSAPAGSPSEGSVLDVHLLFWAELEGGRRKFKTRTTPFTIEEVGDLIDELGGPLVVNAAVRDAMRQGQPRPPDAEEAAAIAAVPPSKKAQARGGTGTHSSRKASKSA